MSINIYAKVSEIANIIEIISKLDNSIKISVYIEHE